MALDIDELHAQLFDLITLVSGANSTTEGIVRWMEVAIPRLAVEPAEPLAAALYEGMEHCRFPSDIVPFVLKFCREWKEPHEYHLRICERIERYSAGS